MAKIKNAIIDGTYYQEAVTKTENQRFIDTEYQLAKFFDREIAEYELRLEREERAARSQDFEPKEIKRNTQYIKDEDWAHDQMVEDNLTLTA